MDSKINGTRCGRRATSPIRGTACVLLALLLATVPCNARWNSRSKPQKSPRPASRSPSLRASAARPAATGATATAASARRPTASSSRTQTGSSSSSATSATAAVKPLPRDEDLVIVLPTAPHRLELAHTSARASRGLDHVGTASTPVRAVFVLNDSRQAAELQHTYGRSHNETYLAWPDRPDKRRPGDARVALAPWLAAGELKYSFKWMLFGDDDTLFFLDGVKDVLRDYDPELPYLITDSHWHRDKQYMQEAPRCLPCHVTPAYRAWAAARPDHHVPKLRPGQSQARFAAPPVPPAGCPCTPDLACAYTLSVSTEMSEEDKASKEPVAWAGDSKRWGFPRDYPGAPCDYSIFHGGSGVLISVAAMRMVSFEQALDCMYDFPANVSSAPGSFKAMAHGDRMTSRCFWLHGLALTDPGLALTKHRLSSYVGRAMDSDSANRHALERVLEQHLGPEWLWSVLHMVAAHIRHSNVSAAAMRHTAALYGGARYRAAALLAAAGLPPRGELDAHTAATRAELERILPQEAWVAAVSGWLAPTVAAAVARSRAKADAAIAAAAAGGRGVERGAGESGGGGEKEEEERAGTSNADAGEGEDGGEGAVEPGLIEEWLQRKKRGPVGSAPTAQLTAKQDGHRHAA
ncbi:hypothetical protein HXX76_011173 [Chlamydomonas incerta]|uniref:Uncharacterized protein n=1 Tax=Chlamydomonas incerta TaxID=51695 RepID=A0A835SVC3_CHLIN|nr:hypothetical protein HXX76_011173 [Chlamydomonas incerta]|eukprot:KAG2428929.1 hypothetical protein HXX76_011173 [Chlamydomonas incerta]